MPDIDDGTFGPLGQQMNPAYAADYANQLRALATHNLQNQPEAKSWAGVLGNMAQTLGGLQQMNRANALQQAGMSQAQQARSNIGQPGVQGGGGLLGSAAPTSAGGGGDPVSAMAPAIAQQESGGAANPYAVRGRQIASGDRAYGKYQVMGANIPNWTQEALGQSLTPAQFLASPQAQETVFHSKMGQYLQQTGTPQDAASMWFSGKPLAQALAGGNRPDVNGTRPSAYAAATVAALREGGSQQGAQASPTTGMNGRQYGALMTNSWIPQEEKQGYQRTQTPQLAQDATGGLVPFTPGQSNGGQVAPGWATGTIGTPQANIPIGQTTRGGIPQGQGPFTQGQNLTSTVAGAANLGNTAGEIGNDLAAVNTAKEGLPAANARLGQIQSFRALGGDVDHGALPIWDTLAARFGVQWGSDPKVGREQAYQAMAEQILGGKDDSFKASIPGLSTTPEGRQMIADYLENQARYQQKLGQIAAFGKGTATQRRQQMLGVEAPQSYFSQGGGQQPQQPPPGGSPNAPGAQHAGAPVSAPAATSGQAAAAAAQPPMIADEAGYKALKKGDLYTRPDGTVMRKK